MIPVEDYAAQTVVIADRGSWIVDRETEVELYLARYKACSSRFVDVQGEVERAHASGLSAGDPLAQLHRLARELDQIEQDLLSAAKHLHAAVHASACNG